MFSSVAFLKKLYLVFVVIPIIISTVSGGSPCVGAQGDRAVTEYTIPTEKSQPFGITAGPDGALWFTEQDGNKIGRLTMDGKITEFPIPTAESIPGLLTGGPDGAIWFLERLGNKIGRITMDADISEYSIPTGGREFQTASGKSVTSSTPQGIVSVAWDKALWFTEQDGNKIGRITTEGKITEYPLPAADSAPFTSPFRKIGVCGLTEVFHKVDRSKGPVPIDKRCGTG